MEGSRHTSPEGGAFGLLSPRVRQSVHDMGWATLRPVQERAIEAILRGTSHTLIVSPTGTGKTEAAFLPIISLIEAPALPSLGALYVSPLKALINDQFQRLDELCARSGVPVHRWHGDVSASAKRRAVASPAGILQLTPESLESLIVNRTENLRELMHALRFVVVDELQSFLGTSRGCHLRSLIHRVGAYSVEGVRLVAMSGTIGDPGPARSWLSPASPQSVVVVEDPGGRKVTRYALFHHPVPAKPGQGAEPALAPVARRLRPFTERHSALIFCNTKRRTEELAHALNSLCVARREGVQYLVHHGAMAPEERAWAEESLKAGRGPVSVVCTSTLELGIDVGELDLVAQLDSTWSAGGLAQRLGRSGRRDDRDRVLVLVTTDDENLLQSCAVVELFLEGWVEPRAQVWMPYDVLLHQTLSTVEEHHGLSPDRLVGLMASSPAFQSIPRARVEDLVEYMVGGEYLAYLAGPDDVILGPVGECIVRSRHFYSVFEGFSGYTVVCEKHEIGEVPSGGLFGRPGARFILGGRPWEVVAVDRDARRLEVKPCADGALLDWAGSGELLPVDHAVRSKMVELLSDDRNLPYVDGVGVAAIDRLRFIRRVNGWGPGDRALLYGSSGGRVRFEAYAGAQIQETLCAMVRAICGKRLVPGTWGSVCSEGWASDRTLEDVLGEARERTFSLDELASSMDQGAEMPSKFGKHLPTWAHRMLHATYCFDIEGTQRFLDTICVRVVRQVP